MTTIEISILSQIGDFIVSARAELFLFCLAIVAHFVLFGNVFPRGVGQKGKNKIESRSDVPVKRVRNAAPQPKTLEECEKCLQISYEDGDYHSVLRCWNQLKILDETPSSNLSFVVEAMQRFQKDNSFIVAELTAFFKKHDCLFGVGIVNELLESLTKTLDTDLAEKLVEMLGSVGMEPNDKTYEALLSVHFAARNFRNVWIVLAEMEKRMIPISARANAVFLKTALRTTKFAEALHRFREARRLWSETRVGEAPDHVLPQMIDLACKEHQLPILFSEIKDMQLTPEGVNTMLAECAQTRNSALIQEIEGVARSKGVALTDRSYLLLFKAAGSSGDRAHQLFDEIVGRGIEWSIDMAVAVLTVCQSNQDFELADRLNDHVNPTQVPILCALMRFYSENGRHEKVCDIYERHLKMSQDTQHGKSQRSLLDARTERCLMNSLLKCGRESLAKGILDGSLAHVAKHIAMIRDCAEKGNLEGAVSVFTTLEKSGAELTHSMYNSVLDACVECGDIRRAELWMQHMKSVNMTDLVTYNTMVKGLVRSDNFTRARALMEELSQAGLVANHVTYNEIINGMVKSGYAKKNQVWEVIDEMKSKGIVPNRVTCSILLKDLKAKSNHSDITRTMALIDGMSEPMDEVLLSSVVEACVRVGKPDLLTSKLAQLQGSDKIMVSGAHTFGSLIKAYGHAKDIDGAWRCWKEMRSRHIKPTSITIGCMVEAVVTNGDPDGAFELIHQMQEDDHCREQVNAVIYCSVLKGFAQAKKVERAFAVWDDMMQKGVMPSLTTYNALLDACARNGLMDRVPQLLQDMKARRLVPNLITYSTVLKGHCLRGDVTSAFSVLESMKHETNLKPDEIMYNTLLDGCAQAKLIDEGMRLLAQMEDECIRPSNYTLSILVKLASHARRLDQAFDLIETLTKKHRFKANAPVYGNLIQACVANKATERGLSVLEQMGKDHVNPDIRTYGVLTRSCMSIGQYNEAVRVLRAALALPGSGNYPAGNIGGNNQAARGLDDLTNDTISMLVDRGHVQDMAAPLLSDIREHRPRTRVDPALQRKIATSGLKV